jgi:hypothetical protein
MPIIARDPVKPCFPFGGSFAHVILFRQDDFIC